MAANILNGCQQRCLLFLIVIALQCGYLCENVHFRGHGIQTKCYSRILSEIKIKMTTSSQDVCLKLTDLTYKRFCYVSHITLRYHTSRRVTSHRIAPHHIKIHHITLQYIVLDYFTLHHTTSHHTSSISMASPRPLEEVGRLSYRRIRPVLIKVSPVENQNLMNHKNII